MKKITLTLLFTIALTAVHAQKIKLGVDAGATYSGFRGTEAPLVNYTPAFGFAAGLSLEYPLNANLSLKANPSFERKSFTAKSMYTLRESFEDFPQDYQQTLHFHFDNISLPILVKYDFGKNKDFFVNGGVFVAYILKASAKDETYPPNEFSNRTTDFTDSYNRFDYGLSAGFGTTVKISAGNAIVIELRDNFGLAKLNKSQTFSGKNISSNSLNLLVGWSFDL